MGQQTWMRSSAAANHRNERDAQKRRRELEREAKEQAKLSEKQRAVCEVSLYENQIELLQSVHKDKGPVWDWVSIASTLPPAVPRKSSDSELRARQRACVAESDDEKIKQARIEEAQRLDERDYQNALQDYATETSELEKLRALAEQILAGESKAYTRALAELIPLAELSSLGSSMHFIVHDAKLVECILKINGTQAVPDKVKTLTSSEKLSVRPMPRARFHELYQDYICGCVLRVAREVFALLPVNTILVTATADIADQITLKEHEAAVLSTVITRAALAQLDFDRLDPSDTLDAFLHRGDFKASRKSGAFAPINPLTPVDIRRDPVPDADAAGLLLEARRLRDKIRKEMADLHPSETPLS